MPTPDETDFETDPPAPPPARPTDETDEVIDSGLPGYALLGVIGKGACGVVYRARQHALDRVVALKTVTVQVGTAAARFEKEALALAKLTHPHIVQVYDAGHRAGRAYLAMELLAGEDLEARIQRCGPVDERTAWLVARQVAAALAHAAAQGVYHRDVKPANLFLVPPPTGFPFPPGVPMAKVTDFGLALTAGAGDTRLTQAGVTVGTPIYMAPEQFASPDVDHRADIYALGATVHHMLAGKPPFDGKTVFEVMRLKAGPVPPLGPPVSAATDALVAAMLATDPDERVGSYDDLIARIDALPALTDAEFGSQWNRRSPLPAREPRPGEPRPQGSGPAEPPSCRRHRLWPVAAAAAVLAAAVGGWAVWPRGGSETGPARAADSEYEPAGEPTDLIDPGRPFGGWKTVLGTWDQLPDGEGVKVLTGSGEIRPAVFGPPPEYRVAVILDLDRADRAAVTVAGDPAGGRRLVVRASRAVGEGVALGWLRDGGRFEPLGDPQPYPSPDFFADGRAPYLEVRVDRAGGQWLAQFDGKPVGRVADRPDLKPELAVAADRGRPVRIRSAAVEKLRPK